MNSKTKLTALVIVWLGMATSTHGQFVIPRMGGGQIGLSSAPMKHADITFDGNSLHVHVDDSIGTPELVALEEPFQFDREQPWSVLDGKAYNFQYGWNPGGSISLPSNAGIWMAQIQATPGLEVYQRPPAQPSYERIFTTDDDAWRWPGSMTHNVYAVANPRLGALEATYRVYIGDEVTGEELLDEEEQPRYGSDVVTFQFTVDLIGDFDHSGLLDAPDIDILSQQVNNASYEGRFDLNNDEVLSDLDRHFWITQLFDTLPGDADLNGKVDFADFLSLSASFGDRAGWAAGDFDGDQQVRFADFLLLSQNFGTADFALATVPEAICSPVIVLLGALVLCRPSRSNHFIDTHHEECR